ncbi:uncharacterized protein EDB93DRAFT_1237363 [Suillus bovinus]|uniref:uncharacterized protein n=1 Tax=Suillus bovinus TaxID=48563 RepID=UPI001B86513E|nr:uncharacterized protein EDB93DRAFT_1237363 [Suillus bovinus]KAG2160171.1 hypothetical protein EDB93DRAFT_1237363 [Suillus bovinus]
MDDPGQDLAKEDLAEDQYNTHQDIQARVQGLRGCMVMPYPDPHAGEQIANRANHHAANENLYHPFTSKMDWEVARWAKLRGVSLTAFSDLLAIEGVSEHLSLSFKNANELNALVSHELPSSRFKREQIIVASEAFDIYYCDVIECVRSLYGDPDFARYLAFAPERHYSDKDKTVCLFHDMHTGKWWWDTQKKLDQHSPGGTIIPIIISSNKTQVTLFCNKSIYPSVGFDGLHMASGDGALRRCHLLFASFVGDYPEQLLATRIKFGECPKCDVDAAETGNLSFICACSVAGIKPIVHPFWEDLPFANIFCAITPDVLHQLYQGLIKHLLGWLSAACGAVKIDAHCRRLPPNHNIHLFRKGITSLSHISGAEHAQICHFLLGIVIGRLLRAVWGLLNFLYLAQYPCHSSETLQLLDDALDLFHNNKDIFVELGIRNNFNLPKLHAMRHYTLMIMMLGTTDNYNTEYTKRLHIDYAKDPYCATNHKDEFLQMTRWLERKEKVLRYEKYINWRLAGNHKSEPYHSCPPDMSFRRLQTMTKHPSAKAINIDKLIEDYGATYFHEALARYITQLSHANDPCLSSQTLDVLAHDVHLPFRSLPVFHKIKWLSVDTRDHGDTTVTLDSVHARPQQSSGSSPLACRSDTALVSLGPNTDIVSAGIQGFRVGQVRVIFALPPKSLLLLVPPTVQVPKHLAYIEWFTPFSSAPDRRHGLYELSRSFRGGEKLASIVPLANIVRSVHLIPSFGAVVPREWTSDTVLDDCNDFWLNSYLDRYTFCIFK